MIQKAMAHCDVCDAQESMQTIFVNLYDGRGYVTYAMPEGWRQPPGCLLKVVADVIFCHGSCKACIDRAKGILGRIGGS